MNFRLRSIIALSFMLLSPVAEARIFSYKTNWVAAYVRGTGGPSILQDNAYKDTSGSSTSFDDDVQYNFSGEFGFSFLLGEEFALRVGLEGIQGKNIIAKGNNSGGVKLMDVDSKVTSFNPNFTAEMLFKNYPNSRLFGFGGAGYATVKVQNAYTVNSTGNGVYAPTSLTYNDNWNGTAISYHLGAGWEIFLFDNTTFSLEGGYRWLDVAKFSYDANTNVIRGAGAYAATKGATVRDNSGNKMELHLDGPFVAFSFKFYIPPLN